MRYFVRILVGFVILVTTTQAMDIVPMSNDAQELSWQTIDTSNFPFLSTSPDGSSIISISEIEAVKEHPIFKRLSAKVSCNGFLDTSKLEEIEDAVRALIITLPRKLNLFDVTLPERPVPVAMRVDHQKALALCHCIQVLRDCKFTLQEEEHSDKIAKLNSLLE